MFKWMEHDMTTRFATRADIPAVVDLLLQFADQARVGFRSAAAGDAARLTNMVLNWQQHHYVRIALDQHQVIGVLIAERGHDFWDPERSILQERVWFVLPEYRASRASARLWLAWQQDSDQYIQDQRVDLVMMSTQGSSTDFDPGRRGWRLIEQTWIKE
jgi:hypothetical protein